MTVAISDIIFYAAANRPFDDESTIGGAIDLKTKILPAIEFEDKVEVVSSSSSDTQILTVRGRAKNGLEAIRDIRLNGTTAVIDHFHFDTIIDIRLSSDAVGIVTVKKDSTGATFAAIAAGTRGWTSLFKYSFSEEAEETVRYDKFFMKNTHATDSLSDPTAELVTDPTSNIEIGAAAAVNDSLTAADRLTAPSGITFSLIDEAITLPTPLAASEAIGIWLKQTLAARSNPEDAEIVVNLVGTV